MPSQPNFFVKAFPLFLVLFIDGMGLGLVFPLLDSILVDTHSQFLPESTSPETRSLLFGSVISIFMLCWFFGAAILGDLSDAIGRKKALLICLLGAGIGYFITAMAVVFQSLALLILGRVVAGFTSGSQPIAQAAIVDLSTDEDRARNIGFILLSVSLGFIFGPLIGGTLSEPSIVSWFNYTTPFYFTTILSLSNAALLIYLMDETYTKTRAIKIRITHALSIFSAAFKHDKIRHLSIMFLVFVSAWSLFYGFISMFMLKRYDATTLVASLFMGCLGIGFSIGTGFLTGFCEKRFNPKHTVVVSIALASVFSFAIEFAPEQWVVWASIIPATAMVALGYATILSLFSRAVDDDHQGWVMGVTGAIMALSFGLTAIPGGWIASINVGLPMEISAYGMLIAALMTLLWVKGSKPPGKVEVTESLDELD